MEPTVEEARLSRLDEAGISLAPLTGAIGPLPPSADAEALTAFGNQLWRAAVQGVQSGELWDDRLLYWARLSYLAELRERADGEALSALELASRGMRDLSFSAVAASAAPLRVLVTGFDPFHLDRQIDQSNPSGLAALALDGRTLTAGASTAQVQAAVFPVRFADFDEGMVEQFIEPWLTAGVDMVITISMGRDGFDLERFPGRRRSSAVPDNLNVLTGANPDNPLVPASPAGQLIGPEFLEFTLPAEAMMRAEGDFPISDNRRITTLEKGEFEASELRALDGQTAVRGSGGGYLSNEIAYRTLLANERIHGAEHRVPMGHIHTPRLAGFDPAFERRIVAQIEQMLLAAIATLPKRQGPAQ